MKQYFGNYKGIVVKSIPNKNGICKIYVPDIYPEEYKEKPELLPDAIPVIPIGFNNDGNTNGLFATPKENSIVCVFFDGGNINYPFYFGVIPAGVNYDYLAKLSKENTNITHNTNKIGFDSTINDTSEYEDDAEDKVNGVFDSVYDIVSDKVDLEDLVNKYLEEEMSYIEEAAGNFEEIGGQLASFAETVSGKSKKTGKFVIGELGEIDEETKGMLIDTFSKLVKTVDLWRKEAPDYENPLITALSGKITESEDIINGLLSGEKERLISDIKFLPTSATVMPEEEEELELEEEHKKAVLTSLLIREKMMNKDKSSAEILEDLIDKYELDISDEDLEKLKTEVQNNIDDKLIHIAGNQNMDILFEFFRNGINSVAETLQIITFFMPGVSETILSPLKNLIELGNMFDISIRDTGSNGKKAIDIKIKGDINIIHQGSIFSLIDGSKISVCTGNDVRFSSSNYDIPPPISLGMIFQALMSEESLDKK